MAVTVTFERQGDVGIVTVDRPPIKLTNEGGSFVEHDARG